MKKVRKKRFNFKKIVLIFLVLFMVIYLANSDNEIITSISNDRVIKKDNISSYSGIGQEKIVNKDGYFTTFTTSNGKVFNEYKQNGNSSWSNNSYWGGTMAENGCGITSISIILSGYGKNITPEDLRQKYYPVLATESISSELTNLGVDNSDFCFDSHRLSNDYIIEYLKSERPVLICVWNKPTNNRWTTASHYMVLLATDGKDMVYVSNPNGLENDNKSSGWYNINEITPFLAKALFIETY